MLILSINLHLTCSTSATASTTASTFVPGLFVVLFQVHLILYSCHRFEKSVIPARVVSKWEFKPYFVSHVAKQFVDSILDESLFDVAFIDGGLLQKVKLLRTVCQRRRLLDMARYVS